MKHSQESGQCALHRREQSPTRRVAVGDGESFNVKFCEISRGLVNFGDGLVNFMKFRLDFRPGKFRNEFREMCVNPKLSGGSVGRADPVEGSGVGQVGSGSVGRVHPAQNFRRAARGRGSVGRAEPSRNGVERAGRVGRSVDG